MIQLQLLELRLDDHAAVAVLRLVLEVVVLMVVLGGIKLAGLGDLGDDRVLEFRLGGLLRDLGHRLLGVGVVEDGGAILGALVRTVVPVQTCS